MAVTVIECAHCKKAFPKENGSISKAKKIGAPLYCGKACAGLGRRKPKTDEQKKEEKRLYDIAYRANNAEKIKRDKHAWFKKTYDPVQAAAHRKTRMPYHVEYCRRRMSDPAYKESKVQYDRKRRAMKFFGEFADCFLLVQDLDEEVAKRMTRYEVYQSNGTLNKAQQRKRDHV